MRWAEGQEPQTVDRLLALVKDAYGRFPHEETIAAIHRQLSEAGAAWDRVSNL